MILSAEWKAVQREAQLAAEQIAAGVTALGRANHTQTGYYYQAFFGLSIGLERAGKLVFIADHAIKSGGGFPSNQQLRQIGHSITKLLLMCAGVGESLDPNRQFAERPITRIHKAIEEALSEFAERTRYFNLDYVSGPHHVARDPIATWWEKVVGPILTEHYSPGLRARDERRWREVVALMSSESLVLHHDESGEQIADVETMANQGMQTRHARRWGRMYTLQIVRWLASILYELSNIGAYQRRIQALLGLHEPFVMFLNSDEYLRRRKTWSIYRL